jgi:shikimate O-hydroxycinnamoyltransferase
MEDNMRVLPLSPVDHIFTGPNSYAISFALAYNDRLDPACLRNSLEETLQSFWPLRSKLIKTSSHSYGFQPTDDGLVFEIASSSDAFSESQDIDVYVSLVDSIPGEPLTKIRLTQTSKGSVLGVSISHALVDGFSFFHFLSSWARIAQGKKILSPSPNRELLTAAALDHEEKVTANDLLTRCGLFLGRQRGKNEIPSIDEENLSLSRDTMQKIRAEAQRDCEVPLSDNDVITAYVWKEYGARWAYVDNDATTFVTVPFDFRRLMREVPRMYFGCALAFATASIPYYRLRSASLGEISCLVRKSIAQVTSDYVHGSLSTLEALRRGRGLSTIQQIEVRHPQRGLIVTNISRLPILSVDFGWGTPVGFKATAQAHRGIVILPSDDGVAIRAFPPPANDNPEGNRATI